MASSGSFLNSIVAGNYKLKVEWTQSQDVAENKSKITCSVYFINQKSINIASRENSCTIDGTDHSFTSPVIFTIGTHLIGTVSQDVYHDSNGTKTLAMSATFKIQSTIDGTYYEQITANARVTLDTILKASSVSSGQVQLRLGTTGTIIITKEASYYTHKLLYSFGEEEGTIVLRTSESVVSWTPPLRLAKQIPELTVGLCKITCVTYNGDTVIGTNTCLMTLLVPADIKPTMLSFTEERIDGILAPDWGFYVQSQSGVKLDINGAAGSYGSYIVSYSISGGGFTGSSESLTINPLNNYGDITFKATVTDSRGRVSDAEEVTITVEQYFKPYFDTYTSQRCNNFGALDDDGTYILADALYNYASCRNNNNVTITAYYKKTGDAQWINAGVILASGKLSVFGDGEISTECSYDIRYIISDTFNNISVYDTISTAAVVMDFRTGGKGIAIGKVSETENCFEVSEDWDVKVYGKLLEDYVKTIIGMMHPVGSIYMSVSSINPSEYFGGKWITWGSGRVPVGVTPVDEDFTPVEKTGGSKEVYLSLQHLPSHSHARGTLSIGDGGKHSHKLNLTKSSFGTSNAGNQVVVDSTTSMTLSNNTTAIDGNHSHSISGSTASIGGGNAHNNLQPYITCYMWKRIE